MKLAGSQSEDTKLFLDVMKLQIQQQQLSMAQREQDRKQRELEREEERKQRAQDRERRDRDDSQFRTLMMAMMAQVTQQRPLPMMFGPPMMPLNGNINNNAPVLGNGQQQVPNNNNNNIN